MFNGPGWTLSVEMFFYATFPLLFWISRRSKPLFLCVCATITILTLLLSVFGSKDYSINPYHIPICAQYWGLFTLGILLCYTWQRGLFRVNPGVLPSLLLLFLGYQLSRWISGGIVGMAIPFLLIGWLATADLEGRASGWFSSKWVIMGGEISYAIYILHMPIQSIVYSLFFRCGIFLMKVDSMALKLTYLAICVVATLVASYLAWRFIEVPGRKKIVAWLSPKTP
jgi:peptidoglycan/LPS O-acetylase OafA/YrhL